MPSGLGFEPAFHCCLMQHHPILPNLVFPIGKPGLFYVTWLFYRPTPHLKKNYINKVVLAAAGKKGGL